MGFPLNLIIYKEIALPKEPVAGAESASFSEIKKSFARGAWFSLLFQYDDVTLKTFHRRLVPKPFLTALLIRLLARGTARIEDVHGASVLVNFELLWRDFLHVIRDYFARGRLLKETLADVYFLKNRVETHPHSHVGEGNKVPFYLRTDLSFGLAAGGSVGHVAGVLNSFHALGLHPRLLTTDRLPTIHDGVPSKIILPDDRFWDFNGLPALHFNRTFLEAARKEIQGKRVLFIYQRYSMGNFSGVVLARWLNVPLVLEYNGSEVWINRQWGNKLPYEKLYADIEFAVLRDSDVIVVVSQPLKDELVERGIAAEKILVNPNGVDAERYAPTVDGSRVRKRYGLEKKTVVGFIGTFGQWHGADVLADAIVHFAKTWPSEIQNIHFLFIGDGMLRAETERRLNDGGAQAHVTFTGLVPQTEGPEHLAACDIFASPHVPNKDGSPFFGSPTKLFEYMAMQRPIIASNLDQIGQVLEHDRTAWLVQPAHPVALAQGLRRLAADAALRDRLAKAARQEVSAKYTWLEHTKKILDKVKTA